MSNSESNGGTDPAAGRRRREHHQHMPEGGQFAGEALAGERIGEFGCVARARHGEVGDTVPVRVDRRHVAGVATAGPGPVQPSTSES